MTLFRHDWLLLIDAIKRQMFNLDHRYKGMSYQEAEPYIHHKLNKMPLIEVTHFIDSYGLNKPCTS